MKEKNIADNMKFLEAWLFSIQNTTLVGEDEAVIEMLKLHS